MPAPTRPRSRRWRTLLRVSAPTLVAMSAACSGGDDIAGTKSPALTALQLAPADLPLLVGATGQLQASLQGVGASTGQATVTYSSASPSVAVVNATSGHVTAISPGTAIITATGTHPATSALTATTVTGTSRVTVSEPPVGSIELTVPDEYLQPGPGGGRTSTTISAVVKSTLGTVLTRTVDWNSSAPAVATVDATGQVTALSTGSAVITASVAGVSRTATINVVRAFAVVRADQPTTGTYQSGTNSAGRPNTILRRGVGLYTITFEGLGLSTIGRSFMYLVNADAGAPNAALTAIAAVCHVQDGNASTPVTMDVRCEDPVTGANKDAAFRAMLIGDFSLAGAHAFSTHAIGASAPYQPAAERAFNSAAATMTVTPNVEPGAWNSLLTRHDLGLTVPNQMAFAQVITGVAGRTCHVRNQQPATPAADILCYDRSSFVVDATHQVLRLSAGRSGRLAGAAIFSAPAGTNFGQGFTSSGPVTTTRTGDGKYTVTFPGLTAASGPIGVVASPWSSNDYLHCVHHVVSSSPVTIDIACVGKTGAISGSQVSGIQLLVLQ